MSAGLRLTRSLPQDPGVTTKETATARVWSADELARALPYGALVEALREAFRDPAAAPLRHHIKLGEKPGSAGLLLMPAACASHYVVKVLGIFPGNPVAGLPTIRGTVLLCSAINGELLAVMDAGEVTARRTAAASALAAQYLARADASRLLLVGSGRLIPYLAEAHAAVRPIRQVMIWARDATKAAAAVRRAQECLGASVQLGVVESLESAVAEADIISCATSSTEALLHGRWLQPGTHVDLVGSYQEGMQEADLECLQRSTVFVDTRAGALAEAGEIIAAIRAGQMQPGDIAADLSALARGEQPGRQSEQEITLFKSVGCAQEDLAAAVLAFQRRPA